MRPELELWTMQEAAEWSRASVDSTRRFVCHYNRQHPEAPILRKHGRVSKGDFRRAFEAEMRRATDASTVARVLEAHDLKAAGVTRKARRAA